jgi:2'-5' RNA ligase/ribosomal protein L24
MQKRHKKLEKELLKTPKIKESNMDGITITAEDVEDNIQPLKKVDILLKYLENVKGTAESIKDRYWTNHGRDVSNLETKDHYEFDIKMQSPIHQEWMDEYPIDDELYNDVVSTALREFADDLRAKYDWIESWYQVGRSNGWLVLEAESTVLDAETFIYDMPENANDVISMQFNQQYVDDSIMEAESYSVRLLKLEDDLAEINTLVKNAKQDLTRKMKSKEYWRNIGANIPEDIDPEEERKIRDWEEQWGKQSSINKKAGIFYEYGDKKENGKYVVFKITYPEGDSPGLHEDKAEAMARQKGMGLSGGGFSEDSKPYNFDEEYVVYDTATMPEEDMRAELATMETERQEKIRTQYHHQGKDPIAIYDESYFIENMINHLREDILERDYIFQGNDEIMEIFEKIKDKPYPEATNEFWALLKQADSINYSALEDELERLIEEEAYSDTEMYDTFSDDFYGAFDEALTKLNKGGTNWNIAGENMGWQQLSVTKEIDIKNAREFVSKVLPKTDMTIRIWEHTFDDKTIGLYLKVSHHDAPMGESYYCYPLYGKSVDDVIREWEKQWTKESELVVMIEDNTKPQRAIDRLQPIPNLWYEDELGNKMIPDLTGDILPDEYMKNYPYQHARFPVVRDSICTDEGEIMSGETSFNCVTPIVLYLVTERGWTLPDAITVAATNCERCMNILLEETTGEPYLERETSHTHCDLCAIVDPEYDMKYKNYEAKRESGELQEDITQPMVKDSSARYTVIQRALKIAKLFRKNALEDNRYEEFQNNTYVIFTQDAKFKMDQLDAHGEIKTNMIGKIKKVNDSTIMVEVGKQLYEIPLLEAFKVMEPFMARVVTEDEQKGSETEVPEEVAEEQPEGTEEAPEQARPGISTEREQMRPVPIKTPKKPLEKALEQASIYHNMMRKMGIDFTKVSAREIVVGDTVWLSPSGDIKDAGLGNVIKIENGMYTVEIRGKDNVVLPAERLLLVDSQKPKEQSMPPAKPQEFVPHKKIDINVGDEVMVHRERGKSRYSYGIVIEINGDIAKVEHKSADEHVILEVPVEELTHVSTPSVNEKQTNKQKSKKLKMRYSPDDKERFETTTTWASSGDIIVTAEYEHLTVQTSDVPKEIKNQIKDIQSKIDRDMLYDGEDEEGWVEGGLQKLFHMTILYGVNPKDKEAISEAVKEMVENKEILARTGEIEYFDNEDKGHTAMVLRIESEGLKKLHDKLKSEFENEDNFPEYKSHVTIAYLKPNSRVEGVTIEPFEWDIDDIEVANKDGSLTKIAEEEEENIDIDLGEPRALCIDCLAEIDDQEATDIRLCSECMKNYDMDKLWEMHDRGEINALAFNENERIREKFRIRKEIPTEEEQKIRDWEKQWNKDSNTGVGWMEKIILGEVEISDQMLNDDGMWLSRDLWEREISYRVEMIEQYLGNVERGVNVIGNIRTYLDDLEEILVKIPPDQISSAKEYLNEQLTDKPKTSEILAEQCRKKVFADFIDEPRIDDGGIDTRKPLEELNKIIKKKDNETLKMQKNDDKGRVDSTPVSNTQQDISTPMARNSSLIDILFKKGDRIKILTGVNKNKVGIVSEYRHGHGFNVIGACRVLIGNESIWYKESEVEELSPAESATVITTDSEFPAVEADIQAGFKLLIDEMEHSRNPYIVSEIGRKLYKQQQKQTGKIVRDGNVSRTQN